MEKTKNLLKSKFLLDIQVLMSISHLEFMRELKAVAIYGSCQNEPDLPTLRLFALPGMSLFWILSIWLFFILQVLA